MICDGRPAPFAPMLVVPVTLPLAMSIRVSVRSRSSVTSTAPASVVIASGCPVTCRVATTRSVPGSSCTSRPPSAVTHSRPCAASSARSLAPRARRSITLPVLGSIRITAPPPATYTAEAVAAIR